MVFSGVNVKSLVLSHAAGHQRTLISIILSVGTRGRTCITQKVILSGSRVLVI
nr:MAG TPA: hypothetical protein [Podoviridae sp. ctK5Q1]